MKHVAEWLKILAEKKPQNVVNCLPTLALTLQRNEAAETGAAQDRVCIAVEEKGEFLSCVRSCKTLTRGTTTLVAVGLRWEQRWHRL